MKPYAESGEKKGQVRIMFDRIAPAYDRLNHLLSLGIDRRWRRRVVELLRAEEPRKVADIATGTADLALALARALPDVRVVGIDFSARMVALGREKVRRAGLASRVELREGDAEALELPKGGCDAATVAFGVRNFGDMGRGLREMHRILRPGGRIVVLEFSEPDNRILRALYDCYFRRVLPRVGGLVSKDRPAYEYLPASVAEFPAPARFLEILSEAGFTACRAESLTFGVARIYTGTKSESNEKNL